MSQTFPKPSLFSGASWYLLEKLTRLFGAFLIGAWVARYLGPENYGALAYSLALIALLSFLGSFGVESLVVRDLVGDSLEQRQIISTYFFIRLCGALFTPFIAITYLVITHDDARLLIILTAICSGTVIFGAFDTADCWLQAKQKARVTSTIRLVAFFIGTLLKCLLIIMGASIEWFAVSVLIEAAAMACLNFQILFRHNLAPSPTYWSTIEFKRILTDGKLMALSALMVTIYSKVDILAIGTLLSKEVLAPYAIAASMCSAWNMVGMSLVQAWAPRISLARRLNQDQYISELKKMMLVMFVMSIVGSALLSICSSYIFNILLGESYAPGAPIFSLLVWSSIFVFSGVATSQIIVNEKIYWISLFRTFVGVAISLVAIIPVAKVFGVTGIATLVVASSAAATLSILFSASARNTIKKIFNLS